MVLCSTGVSFCIRLYPFCIHSVCSFICFHFVCPFPRPVCAVFLCHFVSSFVSFCAVILCRCLSHFVPPCAAICVSFCSLLLRRRASLCPSFRLVVWCRCFYASPSPLFVHHGFPGFWRSVVICLSLWVFRSLRHQPSSSTVLLL
jgi:hypothetical protein